MPINPSRQWLNIAIALILFISLLVSLSIISSVLDGSAHFDYLYSLLLVINGMALLTLLVMIVVNLRRLFRQIRRRRAGYRLTVSLVIMLVMLAVVPVSIVYYFSIQFLYQRLDNWFDVDVGQALEDSLELSRAAMDTRIREARQALGSILLDVTTVEDSLLKLNIQELREHINAYELTVLAPNNQIIAFSSVDTEKFLPSGIQTDSLWPQAAQNGLSHNLGNTLESTFDPNSGLSTFRNDMTHNLELLPDGKLHISVMQRYNNPKNQARLLYALFPASERISELAQSVESGFTSYEERAYLHESLKISATLILSLVLMLSLLSAIWMSFFMARRFVAPLDKLAEGTRAVARGDYTTQLPVNHLDELGFLVQSFNDMTRRIALARDQVKHSEQMAEQQRAYLEIVLARLSSGVISLNDQLYLLTANVAAEQILNVPLSELLGQPLAQIQEKYQALGPLLSAIYEHLDDKSNEWREELTLFSKSRRRILSCRGTRLQASPGSDEAGGSVIVFDDVTTLIQAQRDAAWSEVARRLAHEIKNPLTPIQLSAERLRQKYLKKLEEKDREVMDRMTHTIIVQVESMKEMVNAFADYAKSPNIIRRELDLNTVIRDVLELYQHRNLKLTVSLGDNLPLIEADTRLLRQVLHNLIKNGLEASVEAGYEIVYITISTRFLVEPGLECVELQVQDQGPGIPENIMEKIFEPYVTSKPKGTGLGLAIVKKIIEEHGGELWVENTPGACVIIHLPIVSPVITEPVEPV